VAAAALACLLFCVSDAVSDAKSAPKTDTPEGKYLLTFKHEYGSERLPHREISDSCRAAARKVLQAYESPTVIYGRGILVNSEEWVLDSNNGKQVLAHRPRNPPYLVDIGFYRAPPSDRDCSDLVSRSVDELYRDSGPIRLVREVS